MRPLKRYQLKKAVAEALRNGHPWVFRDKVSSASAVFQDGEWLQLVDQDNKPVGTGIYQAKGGVAIRVLRLGQEPVSVGWLRKQIGKAIAKRAPLTQETDAYRVLNGENDHFPGVVLDVYAGNGVLQTYTPGVDALGRYAAAVASQQLSLKSVVWKTPSKRLDSEDRPNRLLRGARPHVVKFYEGKLKLAADLWSGQKSGTFLDLRGLRRYLQALDLNGKRVLNLFAYTGTAGLACCAAGAKEVINVDQAQPSLDFGQRYHGHKAQRWVCADIFSWVKGYQAQPFDLIVVDPPSMASNKTQVGRALATYKRIYAAVHRLLRPGGTIVGCCCTSRISPGEFESTLRQALRGMRRTERLPMELDHKPRFDEANYLKILAFR